MDWEDFEAMRVDHEEARLERLADEFAGEDADEKSHEVRREHDEDDVDR